MNQIPAGVEKYVALRRAYGLKFEDQAAILRQFARFCRRARVRRLTVAVVLDWLETYPESRGARTARRLKTVRGFAAYWKAFDDQTEIPSDDLRRGRYTRPKPYIFSQAELSRVMKACLAFEAERGRSNPIRRQTFFTMFGLIAVAGLRRSEAVQLKRSHVDLERGTILIEMTKFRKSRLIPIHPTTLARLKRYARYRDRAITSPQSDHFFVMNRGQPVHRDAIFYAFVRACKRAGLRPAIKGSGFPRIHDLRHTFATRVIMRWLQQGKNVHALMPALSTYLGHAQPSETYWYLTGVPELLRFGLKVSER